MKSGKGRSLHAYGIALDVNWNTNPYLDHRGERAPRFSGGATQAERAQDVKLGRADTDMTRAMIDAVLAIRTVGGDRVFGWGGDWRRLKDAMHFQIEVTPEQIARGIDWSTVVGAPGGSASDRSRNGSDDSEGIEMGLPKIFFDTVRGPLFGGALTQSAVDNMNIIVGSWVSSPYAANPTSQLAYILATVLAEVGRDMKPVRETFAATDEQARRSLSGKPYGRPAGRYGHCYYGRGYVQLTHLSNYEAQSEKLGVDLVQFPDRALEPAVAIRVLINGMMDGDFNGQGHGLAHYVNDTKRDFVGARRTVNVQDRAAEIAGYADTFLNALTLAAASQGGRLSVGTDGGTVGAGGGGTSTGPASAGGTTGPVVPSDPQQGQDATLAAILALLATVLRGNGAPGILPPVVQPEPQPPPTPVVTTPPIIPVGDAAASRINALIATLPGLLDPSGKIDAAKLQELLKTLDPAAEGLTPVNNMLGTTLGKLLDGRKTAIGVIGSLALFLLGGTTGAPELTAQNFGSILGPLTGAVGSASPYLLPITAATTLWGILGKIDKWVRLKK
jgi:hypothetical protein